MIIVPFSKSCYQFVKNDLKAPEAKQCWCVKFRCTFGELVNLSSVLLTRFAAGLRAWWHDVDEVRDWSCKHEFMSDALRTILHKHAQACHATSNSLFVTLLDVLKRLATLCCLWPSSNRCTAILQSFSVFADPREWASIDTGASSSSSSSSNQCSRLCVPDYHSIVSPKIFPCLHNKRTVAGEPLWPNVLPYRYPRWCQCYLGLAWWWSRIRALQKEGALLEICSILLDDCTSVLEHETTHNVFRWARVHLGEVAEACICTIRDSL